MIDITRLSSLKKLIMVTDYVIIFVNNLKGTLKNENTNAESAKSHGLRGNVGYPPCPPLHCFDPKMPILSFPCSFWSFCPNCPPRPVDPIWDTLTWIRGLRGSNFDVGCVGYGGPNIFYVG